MDSIYIVNNSFVKYFSELGPNASSSRKYIKNCRIYNMVYGTVHEHVSQGNFFIFPLYVGSRRVFDECTLPPLSPVVVRNVKEGRGVVVFFFVNEGNYFSQKEFIKVHNWVKDCGLEKGHVHFYHSNLLCADTCEQLVSYNIIPDNVIYKGINYFESNVWFAGGLNRGIPHQVERERKKFKGMYMQHKGKEKPFYFNTLNRVPRVARIFLVGLIKSNLKLSKKTIATLGPDSTSPGIMNRQLIPENHHTVKNENDLINLTNFLDNNYEHIHKNGFKVDVQDMNFNQAPCINPFFYNKSYISVVVETEIYNGVLYLTEKIFKPIAVGHPFIVVGSRHTLQKLKDLGYRTFDRWWDESYDNHPEWQDRVYSVYRLMEYLSMLPISTIHKMVQEMQEVVEHNARLFMDTSRFREEYDYLFELNPNPGEKLKLPKSYTI